MLYTNGGKLELSKCFWILVDWKWRDGIAVMKSSNEIPAEVNMIQSESGENIIITRKEVDDAPKVLVCHMVANGSWRIEYERWIRQGAEFSNRIKASGFDRTCGEKF